MVPQYASEDAELLLVGNKLDCETDREISRQQGEKVRRVGSGGGAPAPMSVQQAPCVLSLLINYGSEF